MLKVKELGTVEIGEAVLTVQRASFGSVTFSVRARRSVRVRAKKAP